MTDFADFLTGDGYAQHVADLNARVKALEQQLSVGSHTGLVTGAIRYNDAQSRWEKWSGSTWQVLSNRYQIDVQSLQDATPDVSPSNNSVAKRTSAGRLKAAAPSASNEAVTKGWGDGRYLQGSNNLSDVDNNTTARANIGLSNVSNVDSYSKTQSDSRYMQPLGDFDAANAGSFPASPNKGDWYRVSSDGTVSGVDLREGDNIYYDGTSWNVVPFSSAGYIQWKVVNGNTTLSNDDNGKTLWITSDCTITLPAYSSLSEGWNCEARPDDGASTAHTIALATSGTDTIDIDAIHSITSLVRSPTTNMFVGIRGIQPVGNVNDGAVMSSGSNSNGNWIKWADGTMMCYSGGRTVTFSGNGGSLDDTWTFPQSFFSSPQVISGSAAASLSNRSVFSGDYTSLASSAVTASSAAIYVRRAAGSSVTFGSGDTLFYGATAWGRWK